VLEDFVLNKWLKWASLRKVSGHSKGVAVMKGPWTSIST